MSCVRCHHFPFASKDSRTTSGHLALGQHTHMATSGVACNHRPWTTQIARPCRTSHARVGFGKHKWSYDVRRDMPSYPLGITHNQMTPGMALSYDPWVTHIVARRRVSHGLIALGQHTPSDIIRHFMPSSSLGSTHDRTTLGVERIHSPCKAYTIEQRWRGMLSSPLDIT